MVLEWIRYITLVLGIWHIDNIFGGVSGVIGPGMTGFNNGLGPWDPGFYSSKAWGWWAKIPILALVKVSEQQQRVPGDGLLKPQVKSTVWGAEPQQCHHSDCGSEPWLRPRVKNRVAAVCFCCSLTQSCPTNYAIQWTASNMPGFSILHYFPEFGQTYVYWIEDAIQPSHPLSPSSHPALNLSQHQGLF